MVDILKMKVVLQILNLEVLVKLSVSQLKCYKKNTFLDWTETVSKLLSFDTVS